MEHLEEEACLIAVKYANGAVLPMVLKTAVELDLFQLIKNSQNNISASELVAHLPAASNPDAAVMLDRILRLLAAHSFLSCTLHGGRGERRYGLSPLGKFFTNNDDDVSLSSITLMNQEKVLMESWHNLKDAILQGGTPLKRAHGISIYEYAAKDARISKLVNEAMSDISLLHKKVIEIYKGFEGIQTLVDVGGGKGTTLTVVLSTHPSIKAINFDLPHVIQTAPSHPGIEHIGGDMFISVPKGDAIFMKMVMLNWADAECLRILKNCKEAVADKGKVVIVDYCLPEIPESGKAAGYVEMMDVLMLAYNPGAKLRTTAEFQALAKEAGFKEFRKVCTAFNLWVMELYK